MTLRIHRWTVSRSQHSMTPLRNSVISNILLWAINCNTISTQHVIELISEHFPRHNSCLFQFLDSGTKEFLSINTLLSHISSLWRSLISYFTHELTTLVKCLTLYYTHSFTTVEQKIVYDAKRFSFRKYCTQDRWHLAYGRKQNRVKMW